MLVSAAIDGRALSAGEYRVEEGRLVIAHVPAAFTLDTVVRKCLAKKPYDRYPDAESLSRALDEWEGATWTQRDASAWWSAHEAAVPVGHS